MRPNAVRSNRLTAAVWFDSVQPVLRRDPVYRLYRTPNHRVSKDPPESVYANARKRK